MHRIQTCIAIPNRNHTTVCMLSPCNKVMCSLSFRKHFAIISAPCIAADTCGFLYHNSPIKVLPYLATSMHMQNMREYIVGDLIFLKVISLLWGRIFSLIPTS